MKSATGIILCAGNSTRYGKGINKNLEIVGKHSILGYSLNVFNNNSLINEIILAIRDVDRKDIEKVVDDEHITKKIKYVIGGCNRQESVYNALMQCDSDIVLIHDGARPLIKDKYINECIQNMSEYKGVAIGVLSKDTIKIVNDNYEVVETTNRDNTWIVQTPQCFDRKVLFNLHQKYKDGLFTDDCGLLEKDGYKVKLILGDYTNIKITTKEDINVVQNFMK